MQHAEIKPSASAHRGSRLHGLKRVAANGLFAYAFLRNNRPIRLPGKWRDTVVVTGFFGSGFGLGRAAELTASTLESAGFKVVRHDPRAMMDERNYFSETLPGPRDADWIIQINPPEMLHLFTRLDPRQLPLGQRIGYWAWELEKAPDKWLMASQLVDEVWAPSPFTAASMAKARVPVRTMPHPVVPNTLAPAPNDCFTVFIQLDGRSSLSRKNPIAALNAYTAAFRADDRARLVLKTQHLSSQQRSALAGPLETCPHASWIDEALDSESYKKLFATVSCVLSTHRSEGFGLALAEAAADGKIPIATGWSGNMSFMSAESPLATAYSLVSVHPEDDVYGDQAKRGLRWAEADIESTAAALRQAYEQGADEGIADIRTRLSQNTHIWADLHPGAAIR